MACRLLNALATCHLPLATCCLLLLLMQLSWLNEAIMIIISGTINDGTQIGGKAKGLGGGE